MCKSSFEAVPPEEVEQLITKQNVFNAAQLNVYSDIASLRDIRKMKVARGAMSAPYHASKTLRAAPCVK